MRCLSERPKSDGASWWLYGICRRLTDRIDWNGNNVLAVRVSAEPDPLTPPGKPQDKMDFYYYSGIYRDVRMVITDKVYITDRCRKILLPVEVSL